MSEDETDGLSAELDSMLSRVETLATDAERAEFMQRLRQLTARINNRGWQTLLRGGGVRASPDADTPPR